MRLAPDTHLGPYQVLTPLGAGGMGEVYRALDTRLGRHVALKVISHPLSASAPDRARFLREAKAISSLNHPNICSLYDIGHEDGTDFLVMELLEGETLAHRLQRGALPLGQVLQFGIQVADALSKAHGLGIVHRDLKPSNVMITKAGAKLMDFGLARMEAIATHNTATVTADRDQDPITSAGVVVGTFQYMAPERLEGKDADQLTDIWALGCVLYEMATGSRAFDGLSSASIISAIMQSEPKGLRDLSPLTPLVLHRVVMACLAKEPGERVQAAHDVTLLLRWIAEDGREGSGPIATKNRTVVALSFSLIATTAALVAVIGLAMHKPGSTEHSATFMIPPPEVVSSTGPPVISPDGQYLAFVGMDSARTPSVWVRPMNSTAQRRIQDSDNVVGNPFWSPDSRHLAFFSAGRLYKVDVDGGLRQEVCEAPTGRNGAWNDQNIILFDSEATPSIQRVLATGGTPTVAIAPNTAQGETTLAWPQFVGGGGRFLFLADRSGQWILKAGTLDSHETTALLSGVSRAEYSSGHLFYEHDGALIVRPFNKRTLSIGAPKTILENIQHAHYDGSASFSVSNTGSLAYKALRPAGGAQLQWISRSGRVIGAIGERGLYGSIVLSSDNNRLAVDAMGKSGWDIWDWDLVRGTTTRVTNSGGSAPIWTPDDAGIAYRLVRNDTFELHVKTSRQDSTLFRSSYPIRPCSWSSDGTFIIFTINRAGITGWDIERLKLRGQRHSEPLIDSPYSDVQPALSPDMKWVAFSSDETGRYEVYVLSAEAEKQARIRISTHGGTGVCWGLGGRELYYISTDQKLMLVRVDARGFSSPQALFPSPLGGEASAHQYAVSKDGERFLFIIPPKELDIAVSQNWQVLVAGP